jgi:hypothetical protein
MYANPQNLNATMDANASHKASNVMGLTTVMMVLTKSVVFSPPLCSLQIRLVTKGLFQKIPVKKFICFQNKVVPAGTDFKLTCRAVGVPDPYINWRLNWGKLIFLFNILYFILKDPFVSLLDASKFLKAVLAL